MTTSGSTGGERAHPTYEEVASGGTTHAEIAAHEGIKSTCPGFASLAGLIGDIAVRHMGTIGGSVANYDPAADYPAALKAMGATIHTSKREMPADENHSAPPARRARIPA